MTWRSLSLLLALLVVAPARGQSGTDSECQDDRGLDRCAPEQQARVRTLFGVGTIELHRDAGDQVRRVFYVDGYGYDVVAIAFVRRPGHDPEVRVHFRREEGEPEYAPLVAPVPAEVWDLLIDRSALFDRALVPLTAPAAAPREEQAVSLCMHSWIFTVEAADPAPPYGGGATLRRRTEDACSHGTTGAFAREVYRAALPLFPHCALLDPAQHRSPANQLAACRMLSGDRLPAARVLNQVEALLQAGTMAELPTIAPLFNYQTRIDWNGELHAGPGSDGAARFFLSKMLEQERDSFFIESIEGLSDRRVRLRGGFVRLVRTPAGQFEIGEIAPAEMIWELEYRDFFQIRSVTIGPYARRPRR